jgi:hypothetical protein
VTTTEVLAEIGAERIRQDAKWGEQNHPLIDQLLVAQGRPHTRFAEEYEIPTALRATLMCQGAAAKGEVTWLHILVEEVSEFMAAAETAHLMHGAAEARAELVQVAAVAVAAIEAMDRNSVEAAA